MDYLIYSIEDDKDISHIINVVLSKQGYIVKSFYNGRDFYNALKEEAPQMILLDMMLPDTTGQEILKNIRSKAIYDDVEIIIISAKRMLMDKVDGLDLGADDYIEKPFDVLELMSRVNAKYRRYIKKISKILKAQDLVMNLDEHIVTRNGNEIELTSKEFEILKILLERKGKVVSRDELLGEALESRTIDMHIKSIRKKLNDTNSTLITTVYGVGYKVIEWERNLL